MPHTLAYQFPPNCREIAVGIFYTGELTLKQGLSEGLDVSYAGYIQLAHNSGSVCPLAATRSPLSARYRSFDKGANDKGDPLLWRGRTADAEDGKGRLYRNYPSLFY